MFGSMSDLLRSSGQARKSLSFGTRCGFSILSWSWWWAHLHQTPTSSQHMNQCIARTVTWLGLGLGSCSGANVSLCLQLTTYRATCF